MKFPFIKSIGPETGLVSGWPAGADQHVRLHRHARGGSRTQEFMAVTDGKPNNLTLAYHWARMIEVLHSIEKINELLHDPDLQGTTWSSRARPRRKAIGILEAPRGTLFHHYRINENDQVTMCNLIVSTTSNNEPMNRAVQRVAEDYLSEQLEITEGMLNRVEVAIRAYDPCLSCATHAMGQMPLEISLVDAAGKVLDKRSKSA